MIEIRKSQRMNLLVSSAIIIHCLSIRFELAYEIMLGYRGDINSCVFCDGYGILFLDMTDSYITQLYAASLSKVVAKISTYIVIKETQNESWIHHITAE